MASMNILEERECFDRCKCTKHGEIVCATLTKRSALDSELCAYLHHICCSCESVKDAIGRTALHVAASCGRINVVKWLIRVKHANINAKDDESGYTPLHRSIFYGKLDVAVYLIKLGANMSLTDFNGLTSLEHAMKDCIRSNSVYDLNQAEVYVWGSNTNYVLGPQQARLVPELLDAFHKEYPNLYVQQVCLEKFHCVLITTNGRVFACGHGQGGRLGLPSEKTIMSPTPVKFVANGHTSPIVCKKAAIALDHSIFLTESGHVWTCGLNTHRMLGFQPPPAQILTPMPLPLMQYPIEEVCAERYHSIAWGSKAIYTWGLHGGQLGHDKSSQKYIITPKLVTCLFRSDNKIIAVAGSSSAMAVVTSKGDIYILHEYQCRKIASRQLSIVSIGVVGGKLNEKIDNSLSPEENHELKIVTLSNVGNLYVWKESAPQFARCIFSLNRALKIRQMTLNLNEILFVTQEGEAFQAVLKPRKRKTTENTVHIKKNSFHEFLEKDNCQLLKVTKIPRIHRAVSICSDFKGRNYAVLQASPKAFVTKIPEVSESMMQENMFLLLKETSEEDTMHDVIFKISRRLFPVHRYIIASNASKLGDLIVASTDTIIELSNVHPEIFEQLLLFIYTGTCDILKVGKLSQKLQSLFERNKDNQLVEDNEGFDSGNVGNISAFQFYKNAKSKSKTSCTSENVKDPIRMLQEAAKRFGVKVLQKLLDGLYYYDGCVVMKKQAQKFSKLKFCRLTFPELYDVVLKTKEGKKISAHRCILGARLEYFNNLFSSRWSESSSTKEVYLPFHFNVLDQLIEFLYTDELPLLDNQDIDQVCNLLILSDQLFVLRLKEICECTLSTFITLKNIIQLLSFSSLYNAQQLKVYCMEFICLNLTPILESRSLELIDDKLLYEFANFYCDYNPVMQQRIITPYSYAPSDEIVSIANSMYHISLEDSDQETEIKTNIKSQKRRARQRKSSSSDVNNKKTQDVSDNIEIINEFESSYKIDFQTEQCKALEKSKNSPNKIQIRVKAILSAQDKVNCSNSVTEYTKFPLKSDVTQISLTDFPQLDKHHSFGSYSKSPNKIDKCDMKQKFTKLSQKQRKRLLSENSLQTNESSSPVLPESPRNPWKIPVESSNPVSSSETIMSMNSIITDEKKQKENLVKMRTKLLVHTQMEDKAIEDLRRIYNVDNVFDEIISIERVEIGLVASPVWVHANRTK